MAVSSIQSSSSHLSFVQKKPNKLLKNSVKYLKELSFYSSLGFTGVASVIHIATVVFAIVAIPTGIFFIAVVLTGVALSALALILALAAVILMDIDKSNQAQRKHAMHIGKAMHPSLPASSSVSILKYDNASTSESSKHYSKEAWKEKYQALKKELDEELEENEALGDDNDKLNEEIESLRKQVKVLGKEAQKILQEGIFPISDSDSWVLYDDESDESQSPSPQVSPRRKKMKIESEDAHSSQEITPRRRKMIGMMIEIAQQKVQLEQENNELKKQKHALERRLSSHTLIPKLPLTKNQDPIVVVLPATSADSDTQDWHFLEPSPRGK